MTDDFSTLFESARWFGGKGRGGEIVARQGLGWITVRDNLAIRPEVVTWRYADGSVEYYQLLVAYRDDQLDEGFIGRVEPVEGISPALVMAHDAPRDPEAMSAVVRGLLRGSRDDSWAAVMTDARKLASEPTPRVYGGEQSNTNVLLGDVAILKVFRKLEPGRNLDIQVHDALGRSGQVSSAAKLYGWVSGTFTGVDGDEVDTDLAMVVEQLRDATDGFVMAREACTQGRGFTEHAAALGRALAEIHLALDDAFGSAQVDGDELAATMTQRLDAAIEAAEVIAPHREGLVATFEALKGHQLAAQRIHGDFHLGQTLFTPAGWRIIDFEGEPMKTLDERRLPDSRWRDVAGMLRSFGYATSGDEDPTGPRAQQWLADCTDAFLRAYCGGLDEQQEQVLQAYIADKAAYEVVYEVRNRPDWLPIPMAALEAIAPTTPTDNSGNLDAGPAAEQEN